jgi:hypothetical protein
LPFKAAPNIRGQFDLKSLVVVFGVVLLLIATPFVFTGIDNAITEEYSQSISGVATGAGEYAANVTLGRAVYNDDDSSVIGISSNTSSDTPSAASYNSVSKSLEVSGLDESVTRTLTIEFTIDSTTLPTGGAAVLTLLRWFWIFIILGMAAGAIYAFFD